MFSSGKIDCVPCIEGGSLISIDLRSMSKHRAKCTQRRSKIFFEAQIYTPEQFNPIEKKSSNQVSRDLKTGWIS